MTIAVYCLFSFAVIGLEELFSLWAATVPTLGKFDKREPVPADLGNDTNLCNQGVN